MFAPNYARRSRLFAALPATVYQRVQAHLKLVTLPFGEALSPPHGQLGYAYFPTTNVVTLAWPRSAVFATYGLLRQFLRIGLNTQTGSHAG